MAVQIVALLFALLGGGAMGALITERFRRRRGRTRAIPVIERVNRNPVASELRGIKLFRVPAKPGEAPVEINNVREYQLTLRNTSDKDLRGAEIQFEFSSEDVEPWVSRPVLSKAALKRMEGAPSEPWKKALRWQVPQFPPGDSIEFSFQVVDPATEEYEVARYPPLSPSPPPPLPSPSPPPPPPPPPLLPSSPLPPPLSSPSPPPLSPLLLLPPSLPSPPPPTSTTWS